MSGIIVDQKSYDFRCICTTAIVRKFGVDGTGEFIVVSLAESVVTSAGDHEVSPRLPPRLPLDDAPQGCPPRLPLRLPTGINFIQGPSAKVT